MATARTAGQTLGAPLAAPANGTSGASGVGVSVGAAISVGVATTIGAAGWHVFPHAAAAAMMSTMSTSRSKSRSYVDS